MINKTVRWGGWIERDIEERLRFVSNLLTYEDMQNNTYPMNNERLISWAIPYTKDEDKGHENVMKKRGGWETKQGGKQRKYEGMQVLPKNAWFVHNNWWQ